MKLSVSFLSLENKDEIKLLDKENIDYLHLDIMDGNYVTNKTMPLEELKTYLDVTKPFDVHLMVQDVMKYIKDYQTLNPEIITFHLDVIDEIEKVIDYLKQNNIKVGLALNPNQEIELLTPFLDKIDLVLVMSVVPGKGGQQFIDSVLSKVKKLKELKEKNNYHYLIEIDGGINDKNIKLCHDCDLIVVGSFITNGDFKIQIEKLVDAYV